jgi:hypothetical protein
MSSGSKPSAAIIAALVVLGLASGGCGSGDAQDENEPAGTYKVDVTSASFPGRQYLGANSKLKIVVKNVDDKPIPNLAATIDGFDIRESDPKLADPERPIWVVDSPPKNSTVANTNTWAVGELEPGKSYELVWSATSVRSGTYTLRYQIAAGLDGKAKAVQADGSPARGSLLVRISSEPRPIPDPIE